VVLAKGRIVDEENWCHYSRPIQLHTERAFAVFWRC
jgi:hypothetical protein